MIRTTKTAPLVIAGLILSLGMAGATQAAPLQGGLATPARKQELRSKLKTLVTERFEGDPLKAFAYYDSDGLLIRDDRVERVKALAIPPAWKDVWICPWPNGHIQAVGTDAAGRRQYRYHDQWRLKRDAAKHERVLEISHQLPDVRDAVVAALQGAAS